MTLQEFDNQKWVKGMKARYEDQEYWLRSVNFKERLIGLQYEFLDPETDNDGVQWVRCESVELIEEFTTPMPVLIKH